MDKVWRNNEENIKLKNVSSFQGHVNKLICCLRLNQKHICTKQFSADETSYIQGHSTLTSKSRTLFVLYSDITFKLSGDRTLKSYHGACFQQLLSDEIFLRIKTVIKMEIVEYVDIALGSSLFDPGSPPLRSDSLESIS